MATLAELIGNNPKTCGHDLSNESSFTLITPGEEDFVWLVQHLDHVDDTATSIRVCSKCRDVLPSEVERKAQQQRRAKQQQEAADLARADKIAELKESGQKIYECSECNELTGEDELIQVRWCSHCQQSFSGTDNGRNCEQCNRPFTRKVTDEGCPECVNNYDEDDDGRIYLWKEESNG